jgi:hypothetical protein
MGALARLNRLTKQHSRRFLAQERSVLEHLEPGVTTSAGENSSAAFDSTVL